MLLHIDRTSPFFDIIKIEIGNSRYFSYTMSNDDIDTISIMINSPDFQTVALGFNLIVTDCDFKVAKELYGSETNDLPDKFNNFAHVCDYLQRWSCEHEYMKSIWPRRADTLYRPAALAVLSRIRRLNKNNAQMKTCPNCQATGIPDNAQFCPECGASFPIVKKQKPQKKKGSSLWWLVILLCISPFVIHALTTWLPEYKETKNAEAYFNKLYATGPAGFRSGTEDAWFNTEMANIDVRNHGSMTMHRPYIWVYDEYSKVRLEVNEYEDGLLTGYITYESNNYERCSHKYYIKGSALSGNWTFSTYDVNDNICDSYSGIIDKSRSGYENGYQYRSIFKGTCVNKRNNKSIQFRMYEVDYGTY